MTHGDYYLLPNGAYFGPGEDPPGWAGQQAPDAAASTEDDLIAAPAAGGTLYRQQEPKQKEQRTEDRGQKAGASADAVTFVNEHQKGINTYRVHRGSSKAAAMAFLQAHPVNRNFFYLVVETPEGNFGRDIDGIYAE